MDYLTWMRPARSEASTLREKTTVGQRAPI